jgi:hypothetical protein
MTEWESLVVKDWTGASYPKPVNWDDHPEWFDQTTGKAKRIPGPRDSRTSWGPIQWRQGFEGYEIVCMLEDCSGYSLSSQEDHGSPIYHVYVDGAKVDMSWHSLDAALVDAVRFKYEGRRGSSGPRATEYFLRMVGAPEEGSKG